MRDSPSKASAEPVLSESALLKMASGGETARGIGAGVVGIATRVLAIAPNPCCAIESKYVWRVDCECTALSLAAQISNSLVGAIPDLSRC